MFKTSDFDYQLPPELVAQTPAARRDESRLMVVDRAKESIVHRRFHDLVELIAPGDVMVLNTTRVFRARLLGRRDSGAPAEILLLRSLGEGRWEAMVHPGGKLRPGRVVHVANGFDVDVLETTDRRTRIVRLRTDLPEHDAIDRHGHVPLPPYITRGDTPEDEDRYQTVYARERGSVAAPTAGLHFTGPMLDAMRGRGVRFAEILLHVGAGTFKPVETEDLARHVMHAEWFRIPPEAAREVNAARDARCAVWAVGTTALRALESALDSAGRVHATERETTLFIHPPYTVRAADHLLTNFHLPRSTLLMLVSAFAGLELVRAAYAEAVKEKYRFYSYGDAMLLL